MPEPEVKRFFAMVERVRARGVAVVFISHRLEEVMMIANRVTVLRDGLVIATHSIEELDDSRLVELIVGEALEVGESTRDDHSTGDVVLHVAGLSGGEVADLSIDVRAGEIVGVAGLTGSGRHDVARLLFGGLHRSGGEVSIGGDDIAAGRPDLASKHGIALIPGDRKRAANLPALTVRENLTIAGVGANTQGIRLRRRKERKDVLEWMKRFDVKPLSSEAPMWTLSGGNQQKVILARWIKLGPKLLLLDEPTQGVDVGAKEQIYALVEEAAEAGLAVLLASSDTDELERLCDRVHVLQRGRISATLTNGAMTKNDIDRAVLAVPAAEAA
jgi:ribose transport system ATP-binding protein